MEPVLCNRVVRGVVRRAALRVRVEPAGGTVAPSTERVRPFIPSRLHAEAHRLFSDVRMFFSPCILLVADEKLTGAMLVVLGASVLAIIGDTIVLVVTWAKTFRLWREARRLRMPFAVSTCLLRDGTCAADFPHSAARLTPVCIGTWFFMCVDSVVPTRRSVC